MNIFCIFFFYNKFERIIVVMPSEKWTVQFLPTLLVGTYIGRIYIHTYIVCISIKTMLCEVKQRSVDWPWTYLNQPYCPFCISNFIYLWGELTSTLLEWPCDQAGKRMIKNNSKNKTLPPASPWFFPFFIAVLNSSSGDIICILNIIKLRSDNSRAVQHNWRAISCPQLKV